MNSKEIIDAIKKRENEYFSQYQDHKIIYGEDHMFTERIKVQWMELFDLLHVLGCKDEI